MIPHLKISRGSHGLGFLLYTRLLYKGASKIWYAQSATLVPTTNRQKTRAYWSRTARSCVRPYSHSVSARQPWRTPQSGRDLRQTDSLPLHAMHSCDEELTPTKVNKQVTFTTPPGHEDTTTLKGQILRQKIPASCCAFGYTTQDTGEGEQQRMKNKLHWRPVAPTRSGARLLLKTKGDKIQ